MTRMIERWFPCQEVSRESAKGWGTGNSEKAIFSWFAARPLAQARAAVLCSLLDWPDDEVRQNELRSLVRAAFAERDVELTSLREQVTAALGDSASMLDVFSGRAIIPVEAARLGVRATGIDYSPVATLAGALLADYPLREWSTEPPLPWAADSPDLFAADGRLLADVKLVLDEVERRHNDRMGQYYPAVNGVVPWGYLWAISVPCQNCSLHFPLVGSLTLRYPNPRKGDPGESFIIHPNDRNSESFAVEVHEGPPRGLPTRTLPPGQSTHSSKGKIAICIFCEHVHDKNVIGRLVSDGLGSDELLLVGEPDEEFSKRFRLPTTEELDAAARASKDLPLAEDIGPFPARPNEAIPAGNSWTVQASVFGARTYGDLCNDRQTLSFTEFARAINDVSRECLEAGISQDYTHALTGYAGAVLCRKVRRSTRGATLQTYKDGRPTGVHDLFGSSESSLSFSFDYFETGLTKQAGGWASIAGRMLSSLKDQAARPSGCPARILRGSAVSLPLPDNSVDAVVTDPPYDDMIDYSDASDLFYAWLKRALATADPWFATTSHPLGVQEKDDEVIVKKGGAGVGDHRTKSFYDSMLARAFTEARRVVRPDGVVTIVFGHGDPDVWHRLLSAISAADLVLTGSWPARTEKGGKSGSANIETTLTLACRPAAADREPGRVADVDAEVRQEIHSRVPLWDAAGLALTDQLMASAGPAMEVVGRYSTVMDKRGVPVDLDRYLPLARRYVEEAADIRIDSLPLETFDARTRFVLFWVRLFGRTRASGSEFRWHRLASDLSESETEGLLVGGSRGVRLAYSREAVKRAPESPSVIDTAFVVAATGKSLAEVAAALVVCNRVEDPFTWATMEELARSVPDGDEDGEVWTWVVRNRQAVVAASRNVEAARVREDQDAEAAGQQGSLFGGDE